MSFFSNLVVPALLCLVFLVAVLRRVDLLSAFAKGVEDGLRVVWEMFPSLLLLTLTVGALSSSGAVQLLCRALQAPAKVLGIPEEVLPLALLRPLSGSGLRIGRHGWPGSSRFSPSMDRTALSAGSPVC